MYNELLHRVCIVSMSARLLVLVLVLLSHLLKGSYNCLVRQSER